jgi:NADPH-dependent ferric siderophore reductase
MASPTAPAASRRGRRPAHRLTVLRSVRLTPHLVRVVLGGPGVAGIPDNGYTDRYVKLAFRRPGVTYPEPLDVGAVRETMPQSDWPIMRTYTIRSLDHAAGEMAIDFVVHGDEGVAGPWALAAQPGDELVLQGPGGAYAPAVDVDAHILIGDEASFPAIAVAWSGSGPARRSTCSSRSTGRTTSRRWSAPERCRCAGCTVGRARTWPTWCGPRHGPRGGCRCSRTARRAR